MLIVLKREGDLGLNRVRESVSINDRDVKWVSVPINDRDIIGARGVPIDNQTSPAKSRQL